MCMCVRVHNYGYGIDLCSFMCKLVSHQFISPSSHFTPVIPTLRTFSFMFFTFICFRVVSQNKRPDLQLTSQLVDHYSVTTLFPSQEWELVSCNDLSGAKEGCYYYKPPNASLWIQPRLIPGFTIFIYLMKCKSKNRIHKHHIYYSVR